MTMLKCQSMVSTVQIWLIVVITWCKEQIKITKKCVYKIFHCINLFCPTYAWLTIDCQGFLGFLPKCHKFYCQGFIYKITATVCTQIKVIMATAHGKIFEILARSFRCTLGKTLQHPLNNLQSYGNILQDSRQDAVKTWKVSEDQSMIFQDLCQDHVRVLAQILARSYFDLGKIVNL